MVAIRPNLGDGDWRCLIESDLSRSLGTKVLVIHSFNDVGAFETRVLLHEHSQGNMEHKWATWATESEPMGPEPSHEHNGWVDLYGHLFGNQFN